MNWLFIGAGNMASSLIGGLIKSGETASSIAVVDPDKLAIERAQERFGITAWLSVTEALNNLPEDSSQTMPGFVVAVKPHIVQAACLSIKDCLASSERTDNEYSKTLVISVAAGVRTTSMQNWLPDDCAVVRCMPNTPALLGLGATALYANEQCSNAHKRLATQLMDTAGMTRWVGAESELDAVTAISGSGPAYFFYLIEHMIQAGTELGLEPSTAQDLAIETAFGAASMARAREHTPEVLRENVTSKGGTTAAALAVFDSMLTPDIINSAMQAARDKAIELGNENESQS